MLALILLQIIRIALNAIFACAEIAVLSINETKIPSMKWWSCSTAAGRKRSTPCGNCSMQRLLKSRNRDVENPTAFIHFSTKAVPITESLKYGYGTPVE